MIDVPQTLKLLKLTCLRAAPCFRLSMTRNEEEDYLPESVRDLMAEEGAGWSAAIREYLFFQKRRRLGLLHLIENQGGEVWFYPREGSYLSGGRRSMKIQLGSNKILIFRHDIMDRRCQLAANKI